MHMLQIAQELQIANLKLGGDNPLVSFIGPCVVENEKTMCSMVEKLLEIYTAKKMPFVFKASYDKANKTLPGSYRGPGVEEGLKILRKIKDEYKVPIITDIHQPEQAEVAAEVVDVLQIPALLSKQIDLIIAAAKTGKPVNIKKGQWTAPWEMINVVSRLKEEGYNNVLLTERGTSFGYQNLVNDFRGLLVMKTMGCPVVFDVSHSVSGNGTIGESVGGNREFIPWLSRAAVAMGVDGLFIETHFDPDTALSDGQGSFPLAELPLLLDMVSGIAHETRLLQKQIR